MGYYSRDSWPKYVSVAERKKSAEKHAQSLKKKGQNLNPVVIEGRTIAKTFWGKAWCDNLEAYSDYENRLPRGRTYARNGSVIDLQITKGQVKAQVMGSSLYHVTVNITPMVEEKWKILVKLCSGKIDSLVELLQGKFSKAVMQTMTEKEKGLFPKPQEIKMSCSCPDIAGMCKHIAAVLYGVGAILDANPQGLFQLRHVDHTDLIVSASAGDALVQPQAIENVLHEDDLSALFGIEMDTVKQKKPSKPEAKATTKATAKPAPKKAPAKPAAKKAPAKPAAKTTPKTQGKVKADVANKDTPEKKTSKKSSPKPKLGSAKTKLEVETISLKPGKAKASKTTKAPKKASK
jgi:uncharacterized Zn finger protein